MKGVVSSQCALDQVTPMIADFGIARPGDDGGGTASGAIGLRGTPSFMAPEQIAGDCAAIGPWSDVFALGATLYTLLSGRPPFHAASVIETLDLVRTREPAPLKTLVPGLPGTWKRSPSLACEKSRGSDTRRPVRSRTTCSAGSTGFRSGRVRSRSSSTPVAGAGGGRRLPRFWLSSRSRWHRAWRACSPSGASRNRVLAGRECTGSCHRERQGHVGSGSRSRRFDGHDGGCTANARFERFQKSSQAVRELTAKLRRHQGFAASNLVAICELERQLADDFRRRGKVYGISSTAHRQSRLVGTAKARQARLGSRRGICTGADRVRSGGERPEVLRRGPGLSPACRERHGRFGPQAATLGRSFPNRPSTANDRQPVRSSRFGRRAAKARAVAAPPERWSANSGDDPAIGLLAVLAHLEIAPDHGACARLRVAIEKFPADERPPQRFQGLVADWIVKYVQPYPADPNSIDESKRRLDPDAHADAVIQTLESTCQALAFTPPCFPR